MGRVGLRKEGGSVVVVDDIVLGLVFEEGMVLVVDVSCLRCRDWERCCWCLLLQ